MKGPRYNFVIQASDAEVRTYATSAEVDAAFVASRSDLSWCLEAYRTLSKRLNLDCSLSNRLHTQAVNIVHAAQLAELKGHAGHFIVCVQGDLPRRHWAHYHVVQNKTQLAANTAFVPHWIQPNLIPRSPHRCGVAQVAYVGPLDKADAPSEEAWRRFLSSHGILFRNLSGPWHNLSDVDVLVGIRSFGQNPHNTKPPSRLFSAWHAGVAFIGGSDSAYQQVGAPGDDYLEAHTPQQVAEAVLRLHREHGLLKKLVARGAQKAMQYNNDTIAQTWEALLAGAVLKRYGHWKGRPRYEAQRFRSLLHLSTL